MRLRQHAKLERDLLHHVVEGGVAHLNGRFVADVAELLAKVHDAGNHVVEYLRHSLVLRLIALELLCGLREHLLVVVDLLPTAACATAGKLQIVDLRPDFATVPFEPFDALLVAIREVLKILARVFLRKELLDDFVHVVDASGLLDVVESKLVVFQPLQLLVGLCVRRGPLHRRGAVLELLLLDVFELLLLPNHLLALLEAVIHLHAPLHEVFLLLHFPVALLPLLHDALLETVELGLCHFLRVVGVVREQQQLLVVALLGFQRALDAGELAVEAHSLLLQLLQDAFVGLLDAHCLIVLDHRLVQPVLEHAYVAHLRRVLCLRQLRVARKLVEL
mmetsp:Transcript_34908/g.96368  ORF Transcript_34908/g.96368 Transcript_34908/m.96368 type:complete len:334 (+) Transcript_34908:349-1350(+)